MRLMQCTPLLLEILSTFTGSAPGALIKSE